MTNEPNQPDDGPELQTIAVIRVNAYVDSGLRQGDVPAQIRVNNAGSWALILELGGVRYAIGLPRQAAIEIVDAPAKEALCTVKPNTAC